MKDARGYDVLNEIINKLVDYTAEYFATEEKYFDLFSWVSQRHKDYLFFMCCSSVFGNITLLWTQTRSIGESVY